MRGRDVEPELLDEPRQAGRLALRQVEYKPRQRGRVDDRVLERALEAAPDQPGVESVMAVLDQHGGIGEPKESAPRVLELGRPDEHRAIDVVALARVRVDGRPAVNKRVEKGKWAVEPEALGPDLEDEEGRVARRLHVKRDELGVFEASSLADLGSVDRDLFPGDQGAGAAGFQEKWLRTHQRASASARRAHPISSLVNARSRSTAAA
jgi:hypothetical protein